MAKYIIINRKKHISLLADHRKDPVAKELLKVGDEVCVCAKCKTVYLKAIWINLKNGTCCSQKLTLSEIPVIEYDNFSKIEKNKKKYRKSYRNRFVFFLLTSIALSVSTFYWHDIYTIEHSRKNNLQQKINILNNNLSQENIKNRMTNEQLISAKTKINNLEKNLNGIKNITLRIGKKKPSIKGGYDSNYLMFFNVKKAIKLKQLFVLPKNKGYTTIELYNNDNKLIDSKSVYFRRSKIKNIIHLNFELKTPGLYYLKKKGDVNLWYDQEDIDYRFYKNDILEITGCSNDTKNYTYQRYYQYYYDIHYSIIAEK